MTDARPFSSIPGPPPRFLIGELPAFKNGRPWEACRAYGEKFGPLTRIKILGKSIVVLNGPDEIADVLERNADAYYKDVPRPALLPLSTDAGVFVSPGGEHWAARHRANPLASAGIGPWFAEQVPAMHAVIADRLATLARGGDPARFYEDMLRLSFDVWSRILIGRVLPDEVYESFLDMGDLGNRRMMWKLPFGRPWGKKGEATVSRWFGYFRELVAEVRRAPEGRNDLVAFQLRAGATDDEAIAAELANNYFGGCFSATSGLLIALYELTHHPEVRTRAMAAARALRESGALTNIPALNAEPGLDAVLREGLRVRPPVAFYQRRVKPDAATMLGGYELPASTILFISCSLLHHDKSHWGSDAATFRPARWTSETLAANPYGSGHFFPFGRGPRSCLGERFAIIYMKLALATLLAGYTPQFGAGQPYDDELFFAVIRPKGLLGRLTAVP